MRTFLPPLKRYVLWITDGLCRRLCLLFWLVALQPPGHQQQQPICACFPRNMTDGKDGLANAVRTHWEQYFAAQFLAAHARGRSARHNFGAMLRVRDVYAGLDSGFTIPEAEASEVCEQSRSTKAAGYGELTSDGTRLVLHELRPRRGDVILDLGSGAGRFSLQAALAAPTARSIGVELAPSRHAVAVSAASRASLSNLAFHHGDMLDASLCADATLVYVSPVLFHADFINRLGAMLDALPSLCVIASLGRRFPPSALVTFDERPMPVQAGVSWRDESVPVHFYDKAPGVSHSVAAVLTPEAAKRAAVVASAAGMIWVSRGLAALTETDAAARQLARAAFLLKFNRYGVIYNGPLLRTASGARG